MIVHILKDIQAKLPLRVSQVRWDFDCLTLKGVTNGSNWYFSTISSWRLTKHGQYICGPNDRPYPKILKRLKKSYLVDVEVQSDEFPIDPIFILSNGYCLEIFSDTYLDPWILDMQLTYVYIPNPFEPNCFLDENYDMSLN